MDKFAIVERLRENGISDEKILEELVKAMSEDEAVENLTFVAKMFDVELDKHAYEDLDESLTEELEAAELSDVFATLSKIYEDEEKAEEVLDALEDDEEVEDVAEEEQVEEVE